MDKGLIHIYCGDGKGKTTAAFGLALRCAGAGGRVLLAQFLKGGNSSECKVPIAGIDIAQSPACVKFIWEMTDAEKAELKEKCNKLFQDIKFKAANYDMLIFDELAAALSCDFINEEAFIEFLKNKPKKLEVVITGRNPSEALIAIADYVTEMKKVKHPYDNGIEARKGIEF